MVPVAAPRPPEPATPTLSALLQDGTFVTDPDVAFAAVAARWGKTYERQKLEAPCDALRRIGLECLARRGTWKLVRRFDLPTVLEVNLPAGAHHFLAVTAADDRRATLEAVGRTESVTIEEIGRVWDGGFTVVWRPPRPGIAAVGPAASGGDIVWLRQRLASLDGNATVSSRGSGYDQDLAERIAAFQRAHALEVDGIAGAETLAKLTTVLDPAAPALGRPRTGS
jgi:general secretion pathway protein A